MGQIITMRVATGVQSVSVWPSPDGTGTATYESDRCPTYAQLQGAQYRTSTSGFIDSFNVSGDYDDLQLVQTADVRAGTLPGALCSSSIHIVVYYDATGSNRAGATFNVNVSSPYGTYTNDNLYVGASGNYYLPYYGPSGSCGTWAASNGSINVSMSSTQKFEVRQLSYTGYSNLSGDGTTSLNFTVTSFGGPYWYFNLVHS